jgi:polyisoprenoid-binding protein YceI
VVFNGSIAEHPMDGMARLGFSAITAIRRSQWGLDFALDALSDEVDLIVESEFVPSQPVQ